MIVKLPKVCTREEILKGLQEIMPLTSGMSWKGRTITRLMLGIRNIAYDGFLYKPGAGLMATKERDFIQAELQFFYEITKQKLFSRIEKQITHHSNLPNIFIVIPDNSDQIELKTDLLDWRIKIHSTSTRIGLRVEYENRDSIDSLLEHVLSKLFHCLMPKAA